MLVVWQWPFWMMWLLTFPFLIWYGLSLGDLSGSWDLFYGVPMSVWVFFMAFLATTKTKYTYEPLTFVSLFSRSLGRLVPYLTMNSGESLSLFFLCFFVPYLSFPPTPSFLSLSFSFPPLFSISLIP
jgi:hypothetical protein